MKTLFCITGLFIITATIGTAQNLSNRAYLSVITCGPTQEEVYSAFGHSAFRIHDPIQGIDQVYNYGIFDFDQPNFYLNFARGYLYYKLGVHGYQDFKNYYIFHNRFIHEQILNLNPDQLQKVYNYLQWNAEPENQNYLYDYFYNNCSTKLRDVIATALNDSIRFDGSYIDTHYTIRELTDIYLKRQPWGDLGIDIGLGMPMDKKASAYEYMFLPDYLESGFDHAFIKQNGIDVPVVKKKIIVYQARVEDLPKGLPNPVFVFGFIAFISALLSIYDFTKGKLSTWFDLILFGATGLLGISLTLLWFATDHKAASNNLNILWALPTHLIAVFAFIRQPKWLKSYFLIVVVICALLLITWAVLPQKLHYSLVPLVFTLGMRGFMQYRLRK
jgi:uncharacterized protein DUF4105